MDIHTLSALRLRDALQRRELSSEELVAALAERTDAIDGRLGAFVHRNHEQARIEARAADEARARGEELGPLHGLPFTVKENLATTGLPQTLGIRAFQGTLATEDAVVVAAAKRAGGILLGKTNVPLLLLAMETHNDIWGTTVNPWDGSRSPGGSSGGEAAAIATGQSPMGLGTDIGGSIRIPCAWSGIAGLKPTAGRWSVKGSAGAMPGQEVIRAVAGPMARTVGDLVLLCQALSPERQNALDNRVPPLPLADPAGFSIRGLRVGVYEDDGVFAPAASVRRAVREAAAAARDAGVDVVEYAPPNGWELVELYFGAISGDGARTALTKMQGQAPTVHLKLLMTLARLPGPIRAAAAAAMSARGEHRRARLLRAFGRKDATTLWEQALRRTALQRAELAAWDAAGIDLLIGPPTATPAAQLDQTGDWSLGAWHTMRWNLLDQPAGVVPVSTVRADEQERAERVDALDSKAASFEAGSAGLPVAVQVIGRPWQEDKVLALMGVIERAVGGREGFPHTPIDPRGRARPSLH